jgi:Fic family protein
VSVANWICGVLIVSPTLTREEEHVIDRVAQMRNELRSHVVLQPRRWTGLLARMTRARAIRASNSIEGINVSQEDAIAAVDGEDPAEADRPTWRAVVGYHQAMDYILQRCRDDHFRFSKDVLLAVHFMITQYDLNSNPGNLRPGWVGVRNSHTGELVHEGVDRDRLEPLLDEFFEYMNTGVQEPALIKAAMAHLNLVMLHPFSDGNGRAARCFQTAVLANEGIVAPIFSSIEEYIGRHQQQYYDVLSEVGGGGWNPDRDCRPWLRFCITAHYRQAQTLLRRSKEFERVYDDLANLVARNGLPDRTTFALVEAAFGHRVRNASYRVSADISNNLASRDLKALVDIGLLTPRGEKRGRHYIASEIVIESRDRNRLPKGNDDPFDDDEMDHAQLALNLAK